MALLFVSFALAPLQSSVEEAVSENRQVTLQTLASSINLAEISGDDTSHAVQFSAKGQNKCLIDIKNGIIRLTVNNGGPDEVTFGYYIQNNRFPVSSNTIDCRNSVQVMVKKRNGMVSVS